MPNDTETTRTTSTKRGIVSMVKRAFTGKEILTTEDGRSESVQPQQQSVRQCDLTRKRATAQVLQWYYFIKFNGFVSTL
ncbi:MAG: hypothetical protein ACJ70N_00075 [Nitrososphaera sp.]